MFSKFFRPNKSKKKPCKLNKHHTNIKETLQVLWSHPSPILSTPSPKANRVRIANN